MGGGGWERSSFGVGSSELIRLQPPAGPSVFRRSRRLEERSFRLSFLALAFGMAGGKVGASSLALDAVVKGRFELDRHQWRYLTLVPTASFSVPTPMCQRKDNPTKFARRPAVPPGSWTKMREEQIFERGRVKTHADGDVRGGREVRDRFRLKPRGSFLLGL